MASVIGVNRTLANAKGVYEDGGIVKITQDSYEASALASGSDITLMNIKKEWKIVGIDVFHDALGASSTLAVGDGSTADLFIAAASSASAGVIRMVKVDPIHAERAADVDLVITTGGASITGTIKVVVHYID